ncbi:MAG: hypothetical protein MUP71_10450 [Candidatus Aminicenantes bacterium]|nr:hypothetical protein [Candidatus Aminicenantes bacterium]
MVPTRAPPGLISWILTFELTLLAVQRIWQTLPMVTLPPPGCVTVIVPPWIMPVAKTANAISSNTFFMLSISFVLHIP